MKLFIFSFMNEINLTVITKFIYIIFKIFILLFNLRCNTYII